MKSKYLKFYLQFPKFSDILLIRGEQEALRRYIRRIRINFFEKVINVKKTTIKRAAAVTLAALMAGSAFAGCSQSGDDKGSKADATGKVYWLNFKPEIDETLQTLAAKYTEEKGVEVKVVTAASGTYSQTLISEMDKSDAPTLFVIGNQQGVKDWKDYALDLKDTDIAKELNTDAYNLYD